MYLTPAAQAVAAVASSRGTSMSSFAPESNYSAAMAPVPPLLPPMASGATSLRASAARSESVPIGTGRGINNSVTFLDVVGSAAVAAAMPSLRSPAAAVSAAALQMPRNKPSDHVPTSRRVADGTHLYYIFPDGDEDPDPAASALKSKSGSKSKAKQQRGAKASSPPSSAVVMQIDLTEVGLGSESTDYIAFALMAELAARHLPPSFEWEEGKEPPMCLAGTNEGDDEAAAGQELVVLDVEKLVSNRESVAESATWPVSLFIVDKKVKPGRAPSRVSLLEHQINKAAEIQHQQQQLLRQQQASERQHQTSAVSSSSASMSSVPYQDPRGASVASGSSAAAYSTADALFHRDLQDKSLLIPLLAPRIYPYTPTVTCRTPIRIVAAQYCCRRTGAFVQDRWKVFALDETLSKLPASFLRLVMLKRKVLGTAAGGAGVSSEASDTGLLTHALLSPADQAELQGVLPLTVEFSSRRSSANTNHVPLPHLTVTAARDGTMFVKSVPKKAKRKKPSKKANKADDAGAAAVDPASRNDNDGDDDVNDNQPPRKAPTETSDTDSVGGSSISSYSQSTTQLLHVDVVPMALQYKIDGGVPMMQSALSAQQRAATAQSVWHSVDVDGKIDGGIMSSSVSAMGTPARRTKADSDISGVDDSLLHGAGVNDGGSACGGARIFLPLGKVCVVAKTRDEAHRRSGVAEPSWSTVYTVAATTRADTTDYSKSATIQFAGI